MAKRSIFSLPQLQLIPNQWDILAFLLVIALITLTMWAGSHMTMPFHVGQSIPISLSISALPGYAAQTVLRMFIALAFSFTFSLAVGTLAAKSQRAGQLIIPMIDILQSVPILGYLSIAVVGFIILFPNSMLGPECAAIFVVFTSQVWNMLLSFYQSMKTIPAELNEATHMYHLSAWQRFWRLEVPFAMPGLLWNAMMSMSGSWFFIVAAEAISVGNQNITLPGIGSYIALAIHQANLHAIGYAIVTMFIVIILYDQLFFRPLVAWSDKFRLSEMSDVESHSWVLNIFQRAHLMKTIEPLFVRAANGIVNFHLFRLRRFVKPVNEKHSMSFSSQVIWYSAVAILIVVVFALLWDFVYRNFSLSTIGHVIVLGTYTGARVFGSIFICSLIWVPIGVWVGLRPRVTKWVQPVAQILAAFPANLFFPLIVIMILKYHLNVEIWCAVLMAFGTQWYILFNVIAGASAIPKELKLAASNMQLTGWLCWKRFLFPAIFPYYVTGAITAAGGAWNVSIVAEVISWGQTHLLVNGLGAYIQANTATGDFAKVALGIVIMCSLVTLINLLLWRKLYRFAENRYRLG